MKHDLKRTFIISADFLLDNIVSRMTWFFYPFYLLVSSSRLLLNIILFLSNEFIKTRLGACGTGVRLHGNIKVTSPSKVSLGDNVHIHSAFIRGEGGCEIGDNVHAARNLIIYTANHDYQGKCLPYDEELMLKPVRIENNVWLGINVCIAPGVTIGEGAIVGMGATVTRDVPPLAIVGSEPVRIIKYRDKQHYESLMKSGHYGGMSGYPVRKL